MCQPRISLDKLDRILCNLVEDRGSRIVLTRYSRRRSLSSSILVTYMTVSVLCLRLLDNLKTYEVSLTSLPLAGTSTCGLLCYRIAVHVPAEV